MPSISYASSLNRNFVNTSSLTMGQNGCFGKLLRYGRGIVAFLATNAEWMDVIVIRTGSFGTSKLAEPPTKISILSSDPLAIQKKNNS